LTNREYAVFIALYQTKAKYLVKRLGLLLDL